MSAFGAIVAELAKNRSNITRKIEFPGITERDGVEGECCEGSEQREADKLCREPWRCGDTSHISDASDTSGCTGGGKGEKWNYGEPAQTIGWN